MSSAIDWLQHDTGGLLTLAAVSIAVLLLLIIKVKLEPFIALIIVSVGLALVAGVSVAKLVGSPQKGAAQSILETGFGGILGHIAPIIGLGTVLGAILARSGGADVLTSWLLKLFGPKWWWASRSASPGPRSSPSPATAGATVPAWRWRSPRRCSTASAWWRRSWCCAPSTR